MNVSVRLAELMSEMGVTSAKKLADLSGVSQTMISRILRGDGAPTTTTLELLCGALGVTISEFFDDGNQADSQEALSGVYFRFARDAELNQIDPEDIQAVLDILKRHKK